MTTCSKCHQSIADSEEKIFNSELLCEDYYIDTFFKNTRKTYYLENDHSFMLRLKKVPSRVDPR